MNAAALMLVFVAAAAMALAVAFMTAGRLAVAGALFLSASIIIYLRERFT